MATDRIRVSRNAGKAFASTADDAAIANATSAGNTATTAATNANTQLTAITTAGSDAYLHAHSTGPYTVSTGASFTMGAAGHAAAASASAAANAVTVSRRNLAIDPKCVKATPNTSIVTEAAIYAPDGTTLRAAAGATIKKWRSGNLLSVVTGEYDPNDGQALSLADDNPDYGGPKVLLAAVGLAAGQVISLNHWVKCPTTSNRSIFYRFDDVNDNLVGTLVRTGSAAGTGGWELLKHQNVTIPATAVWVAWGPYRESGTDAIKLGSGGVFLGATAPDAVQAEDDPLWVTPGMAAAMAPHNPAYRRPAALIRDPFTQEPGSVLPAVASDYKGTEGPNGRLRRRYANPSNLSTVAEDAANPYYAMGIEDAHTLRATNTSGIIVYRDELAGLRASDLISWEVKGKATAASTWALRAVFLDDENVAIGAYTVSATYTGTGAEQTFTQAEIAQPVGGWYRLDLEWHRTSLTGTLDVYAKYGTPGPIPLAVPPDRAFPADLYERLDRRYRPGTERRGRMNAWYARLGAIRAELAAVEGYDDEQAVIAMLGISNTMLAWPRGHVPILARRLKTLYGDAGIGYVSFAPNSFGAHSYNLPENVTRAITGAWTYRGETAGTVGLNLIDATSTEVGATHALTATFEQAVVHYQKQVNGGTFRVLVDGVQQGGAVSTSAAAPAWGSVAVTGLSLASHTLTVEVTVAGAAGVRITGADLRLTGRGVRVHHLGKGGSRSQHWVDVLDDADDPDWADALAATGASAVSIDIGGNADLSLDHRTAPEILYDNYVVLLGRIRAAYVAAALPAPSILLVSNYGVQADHHFDNIRDTIRGVAREEGCAFLDLLTLMGDFSEVDEQGLLEEGDARHTSAAGGQVVAAHFLNEMLIDLPLVA